MDSCDEIVQGGSGIPAPPEWLRNAAEWFDPLAKVVEGCMAISGAAAPILVLLWRWFRSSRGKEAQRAPEEQQHPEAEHAPSTTERGQPRTPKRGPAQEEDAPCIAQPSTPARAPAREEVPCTPEKSGPIRWNRDGIVARRCKAVGNGDIIFNKDGTIDKRCRAVQKGDIRFNKDGTIDKRCRAVRSGDIFFGQNGDEDMRRAKRQRLI